MKKILVLASLLVSLSFGLTKYNHFYTITILEAVKTGKLSIGKPCKKVQDKVDGCHIATERKDGGLDQIVVYQNKKMGLFMRVFNSVYPPIETEWLICISPEGLGKSKAQCTRTFGGSPVSGGEMEQFEGDWNELVKKYVKQ